MSKASAVEALLFAALEKPAGAERDAFLDSACGGDAELRRQVERLLQAEANVGSFLQKPIVEHLALVPEPSDATQEFDASTDRDGTPRARTEGEGASAEGDSLDFLQPSRRPDALGRLGHYEVLEVLGQGGFGIVFRAFDEQLQRVVAIKVLAPDLAATSPARKRFLREARASARVRHENVVQVYAVEEEPLPYLVMEFVPGETLQQRIDRTGPLDVTEVAQVGRQLAEGLAAAHGQGLIHRDIKPGNILIDRQTQHVKITDFGLARAADDASLSQSGIVAGTPMYMAPEQASADALDHRADLFSLGSVLYVMCSGRPPFRAPSTLAVLKRVVEDTPRPIREIIPEVPEWLCDLISRLHAKKPEERTGTAREVADLLGRGLAALQSPGSVKPPSVAAPAAAAKAPSQQSLEAAPTVKPRSASRRWLVAATVLLTLLGGLGFTEATGITHVRGTVIRLFSPEGTLEIQVDDPGVSVRIDGSDIVITGAGAREIRLKPGNYTVKASKDGKVVKRELVTVTKNGKQVVRISQEAPPPDTNPDRRAAEYVLSLGGIVKVNGQDKEIKTAADLPREFRLTGANLHLNKQVNDAGLSNFKGCRNLTSLDLLGTQVSDAGVLHFNNCKNLTHLNLGRNGQITDRGLAAFKSCKSLTYLDLSHLALVTNEGLAHFKDCKNLTFLQIQETQVTDVGLAHFKDNNNLSRIILYRTKVGGAGLAHFKDANSLMSIILGATQLTDAGLAHFLKDHRNLTDLAVNQTPITDEVLTHIVGLDQLMSLDLRNTKVTAKGVEGLAKALPKCKIKWDGGVIDPTTRLGPDRRAAKYALSIGGAVKVNDAGQEIKAVADLPHEPFRLTSINLWQKQMTAAGLAVFKDCKNLKEIDLHGSNVTDAGLAHFKDCKDLTVLRLTGMPVTDAGLAYFKDCKNLTNLSLWGAWKVGDAGLAHFKDCKNLTTLDLNATQVSDTGLAHLEDCKNLTSLSLNNTRVSDAGLAHLKNFKNLKQLDLYGCKKVSNAGLAHLKNCKNLTGLWLNDCPQVSDAGLAHFKDCKDLTVLNLAGTPVTDAGLAHLAEMGKLIDLDLRQTKVTAKGVEGLAKALPKCRIAWAAK